MPWKKEKPDGKLVQQYEQLSKSNKEKFNEYVRDLLLAQEREEQLILNAIKNKRTKAAVTTILRLGGKSNEELLLEVGQLVLKLPEEQLDNIIKRWESMEDGRRA